MTIIEQRVNCNKCKHMEKKGKNYTCNFKHCNMGKKVYYNDEIATISYLNKIVCDYQPREELKSEDETLESKFLEIWEMGLKHYNDGLNQWQFRYCVKLARPIEYPELKEKKCWQCDQYILNGGICDPL